MAIAAIAVVGGSLAGCSRFRDQQAPAAATSTPAPATTPTSGSGDSSLSGIQADLNSANSATDNAGADLATGNAAASTNDNN